MNKILLLLIIILESCTLSFSNVDTHGEASDVVDSTPTSTNDIKPNTNLDMPLIP